MTTSRWLCDLRFGSCLTLWLGFFAGSCALMAEPLPNLGDQMQGPGADLIKAQVPVRKEPALDTDHMIWNFGLNGARNFLQSDSGKSILASHGAVQFGAGYLATRWYAFGSIDFITGPFEPATVGELDVDYLGTGFTVWTGMSPFSSGIRLGGVGYGVGFGVSYNDLVGRSIGYGGRRPSAPPGGDPAQNIPSVESYTLETTNVSVIPALFISYLEKPRFVGNTPDLLATRLEGHILTLGLAFPVIAEFSKKTAFSDGSESVESGAMEGRRIEITWTALLAP